MTEFIPSSSTTATTTTTHPLPTTTAAPSHPMITRRSSQTYSIATSHSASAATSITSSSSSSSSSSLEGSEEDADADNEHDSNDEDDDEDDEDVIHIVPPPPSSFPQQPPSSSSNSYLPFFLEEEEEQEESSKEEEKEVGDPSSTAAKVTRENCECPHLECMLPKFLGFGGSNFPFLPQHKKKKTKRRKREEVEREVIASQYYTCLFEHDYNHVHVPPATATATATTTTTLEPTKEVEETDTNFLEESQQKLQSILSFGGKNSMYYTPIVPPRCFPALQKSFVPPPPPPSPSRTSSVATKKQFDKVKKEMLAAVEIKKEEDEEDEEEVITRRSKRRKRKSVTFGDSTDDEEEEEEEKSKTKEKVKEQNKEKKYLLSNERFEQLYKLEQRLLNGESLDDDDDDDDETDLDDKVEKHNDNNGVKKEEEELKCTRNNQTTNMYYYKLQKEEQHIKKLALASCRKIEEYCEVVRLSRHCYWDAALLSSSSSSFKTTTMKKEIMSSLENDWGAIIPSSEKANNNDYMPPSQSLFNKNLNLQCMWCTNTSNSNNSAYSYSSSFVGNDMDRLMKCLECSVVGCGPCSISSSSNDEKKCKQCIMRHFIASGHSMGITCGPRADIFCFRCGDFIYHPLFFYEKNRVDMNRIIPYLSWDGSASSSSLNRGDGDGHYEHVSSILQRNISYKASFVKTSNNEVVFRGFMATYKPSSSSNTMKLIEAGTLALKRWYMFRGDLCGGGGDMDSLIWNEKALRLSVRQSRIDKDNWKIRTPVGLYNLGNTCFMSCILQCLINCVPFQRHFLRDVGHHHKTCSLLRYNIKKKRINRRNSRHRRKRVELSIAKDGCADDICLACEMDKLFLAYFGSAAGVDAIGAMNDDNNGSGGVGVGTASKGLARSSSQVATGGNGCAVDPRESVGSNASGTIPASVTTNGAAATSNNSAASSNNDNIMMGLPIVPSELLAAAWKVGGMEHLAGYEQRDAHEFLQAFLDTIGKHEGRHRKLVRGMASPSKPMFVREPTAEQEKNQSKTDDIVKHLFEGTLRSVLICDKCGCKRSQPEPFLNISLPLAKEMERTIKSDANSSIGTRKSAANKVKISLEACLEHFTCPEALTDPVHCPSCDTKTPTRKQHTFAKLPKILCLHLKRFDASRNKKTSDPVSFPAHGLDMGSHLPHWCEVIQGRETQRDEEDRNNSSHTAAIPKILYDLFATVNHSGTLHQGHYVSNVKVNGQWYHCNDALITNSGEGSGEKEVLRSEGTYMLLYVRR